jgi:hypothetical protein
MPLVYIYKLSKSTKYIEKEIIVKVISIKINTNLLINF